MPFPRRYNLLQLLALTAAIGAAIALVHAINSPPLGSLGLREASLPAAVLLVALWFCRGAFAPRMALYASVSGVFAIAFFVKYLRASDLLFSHHHGPPPWLIAATYAAGISVATAALWIIEQLRQWRAGKALAAAAASQPRALPWLRLLGMACLAALCGLVFLAGLSSLPRSQLEIDYYIKNRIVDTRLPVRQLAERLQWSDLPYRADLAAAMSSRLAHPEDAAAIPTLAALLEDDDPSVRRAAASALLGVFHAMPAPPTEAQHDQATRERILRGQNDPEQMVRLLAIEITRGRPQIAQLPADPNAKTVDGFVAALDSPDFDRRRQALNVLRTMGPLAHAAAPALAGRLGQGDIGERLMVAITLSHVDPTSKPAIDFMAQVLIHPQMAGMRSRAAERLGQLGPAASAAVPQFLEAWQNRMITIQEAGALHLIDSRAAAAARIPRPQPRQP